MSEKSKESYKIPRIPKIVIFQSLFSQTITDIIRIHIPCLRLKFRVK